MPHASSEAPRALQTIYPAFPAIRLDNAHAFQTV
jgi:hypothetical protein